MAKINTTEKNFEEMSRLINKFFEDRDTRVQAGGEVQSIIDYQVIKTVSDNLPNKDERDNFMTIFTENPNDGTKVLKYLKEKGIAEQVEAVLQRTSQDLVDDLRHDIEITAETHSEGKVPVK